MSGQTAPRAWWQPRGQSLAEPYMRTIVDQIGGNYGWAKTEAPDEWWHINYIGP